MSESLCTELVAEIRSWIGWPEKDLDRVLRQAAEEIERLTERERVLLDSHTGCGCDPNCKVCTEKGYT